jgi:hypothetical protein
MDSLKRGFIFLGQAGQIARKYPSVLQPLAFLAGGGMAGALLISLLMAVTLANLGGAGAALAGFLGVLLLAAMLVGGYLTSTEVIRRLFLALSPDQAETVGPAWGALRGQGLDLASAASASLAIAPLRLVLNPQAGGFLQEPWTQAVELVSPAMVIENLGLKKGFDRVSQIVCDNLLFIKPGQVAAGWAGFLAGLPLAAVGVLAGWGVGRGIAQSAWGWSQKPWFALVIGVLIASLFILAAVAVASYSAAAYRTCLFAWAREIEAGRRLGSTVPADPPDALVAALSGMESLTAPVYPGAHLENEG